MSTENEILDSKTNASADINDPTYPGPHGKVFIYKRNLALYRAQTSKLPKAVCDHVSFASEILALPPPYKTRKVRVIATPHDKGDSKASNKTWTEDPDGTPKKGLVFSKSGKAIEGLEIGSTQEIPEPCRVSKGIRELLEMHCYVHTIKRQPRPPSGKYIPQRTRRAAGSPLGVPIRWDRHSLGRPKVPRKSAPSGYVRH
jgi:hypothetical protein